MEIASDELRTLQLGPLWVLSALAGTHTRFDPDELAAFWDTLVSVTLRSSAPARAILESTTTDRAGLLIAFELDDRPVVSGLAQVVRVLDRLGPALAADYKLALLRIGMGVGRARGAYGRTLAPKDEQLLLLVAELLEIERVPPMSDGVLV